MSDIKRKETVSFFDSPNSAYTNVIILCIAVVIIIFLLPQQGIAEYPYEGYYGYLRSDGGDFPDDWTETRYSESFWGATHDANNWYLAQTGVQYPPYDVIYIHKIWRIPIEVTLDTNKQGVWVVLEPEPGGGFIIKQIIPEGVLVRNTTDIENTEVRLRWIDTINYYRYNMAGYLFVNATVIIKSTGEEVDRTVVLNPETFEIIAVGDNFPICEFTSDGRAVFLTHPEGWGTTAVGFTRINWAELSQYNTLSYVLPEDNELIPLRWSDGTGVNSIPWKCDLSPSDKLIYWTVAEKYQDLGERVLVADLETGIIIQKSTNSVFGETGPFNIWRCADCDSADCESINDLVIWDLDQDTRAPNIRGMLHVFVKNEDNWDFSYTDDIRLSHFSEKVFLDGQYDGSTELGTLNRPFNTLEEAVDYSWDRSVLKISQGNYPGPVRIEKIMKIDPTGFPVVFGR